MTFPKSGSSAGYRWCFVPPTVIVVPSFTITTQ